MTVDTMTSAAVNAKHRFSRSAPRIVPLSQTFGNVPRQVVKK
jgi:hypothetical protein